MSRWHNCPACKEHTDDELHVWSFCDYCDEPKCDNEPHDRCNESVVNGGSDGTATLEPGFSPGPAPLFKVFARSRGAVRPDLMIPNPLALRIEIPTTNRKADLPVRPSSSAIHRDISQAESPKGVEVCESDWAGAGVVLPRQIYASDHVAIGGVVLEQCESTLLRGAGSNKPGRGVGRESHIAIRRQERCHAPETAVARVCGISLEGC